MIKTNSIIEKSIEKLKRQPYVLFLIAKSRQFFSSEVIKNQLRKKITSNVILITAIENQKQRKKVLIDSYKKYQGLILPRKR